LRDILVTCTQNDFAVTRMQVQRDDGAARDSKGKRSDKSREAPEPVGDPAGSAKGVVEVVMEVRGARSVSKLVEKLTEIDGVSAVDAGEATHPSD